MATLREWAARWLGAWRPRRSDAELEEELRLHIELATEHERRLAADEATAPRAVGLRVGTMTRTMDALRDQRGWPWLDDLARDVRYGARALRRNPTFTAVALLTLAIGIGANTAVFSIVDGVLLKPLPYPDPEQLVAVWHSAPGATGLASLSGDLLLSPSMFFTYAEQNRTLQAIGVWAVGSVTVTGRAEPEQVRGVAVSSGVLEALGVPPLLGRWLSPSDQAPASPRVTMLGYGYWQRRFGGDPTVIGRSIDVDSTPREIVGVMPRGFTIGPTEADLIGATRFERGRLTLAGFGWRAIARLKPGVTLAEANGDIGRMVPIWMQSWPTVANVSPHVYDAWHIAPALRPLKQDIVGGISRGLWVLMGTLGVVMLIACANVATLLMVRAEGRQLELAIRTALGAGRTRIVRTLLIESLVLGLLGGALGLGVGFVGLRLLLAYGPSNLPRLAEIAIDPRAVAFNIGISLLAGVVFGLIPALKHTRSRISADLTASGRTASDSRARHRTRNALVVAQLAMALVLLVSSGLMIRTFRALHAVEPGFTQPGQVQTMRMSIPPSIIQEPERVGRMQADILGRLEAVPGVTSAAFVSMLPMEGLPPDWDVVEAEDQPRRSDEIPALRMFKQVSPGFFHAMGARFVAGRDYTWTDLFERRPVTIVSENLARELWGSPSAALGKRVRTLPTTSWRQVIGVVQDVYDNGVQQPPPAIVYWPAIGESLYRVGAMVVTRQAAFVVRSARAGTEQLVNELQHAVWSVSPSVALASVRTMQDVYDQSIARTAFTLAMLAIAGAMALTLGIVGVYGVISYAVSQRTREIGIRLALGAQRRELTQMFVRTGLMLAAVGVPIGLAASAAATRLMSSLLYGISPLDPMTYLAVPFVLVGAAAAASYIPARRAAAVDPVNALKVE
jgi:putative ABC transport system permease protein